MFNVFQERLSDTTTFLALHASTTDQRNDDKNTPSSPAARDSISPPVNQVSAVNQQHTTAAISLFTRSKAFIPKNASRTK